jgi:hypothetical protein
MGCQFSAMVGTAFGNHPFPVNDVRTLRRRSRRNSATPVTSAAREEISHGRKSRPSEKLLALFFEQLKIDNERIAYHSKLSAL